jgi:hypothetical protein
MEVTRNFNQRCARRKIIEQSGHYRSGLMACPRVPDSRPRRQYTDIELLEAINGGMKTEVVLNALLCIRLLLMAELYTAEKFVRRIQVMSVRFLSKAARDTRSKLGSVRRCLS